MHEINSVVSSDFMQNYVLRSYDGLMFIIYSSKNNSNEIFAGSIALFPPKNSICSRACEGHDLHLVIDR